MAGELRRESLGELATTLCGVRPIDLFLWPNVVRDDVQLSLLVLAGK